MRELARRRLPRAVFDFVDGGAEIAAARAAAATGTVYTMSHGSTVKIEDLAAGVPGKLWMQVFPYKDRGLTENFVSRAQGAGYQALVLTIDNQMLGQRERDLRNGFIVPPRFELGSLIDMALRLRWILRMVRAPKLAMANYEREGDTGVFSIGARVGGWMDPSANWKEVEWLRRIWKRPLLLDGGVRRGGDVVKALALGATACLIGRPHLWGVAVAGEQGVARVLEIYRREIDRVMALCGWGSLNQINRSVLFDPAARSESVLSAVGRKLTSMLK